MRILFLTSRLPYPPNRGDKLRVLNFFRSLSKEHEIHLASFITREEEKSYTTYLEPYCADITLVLQTPIRSILTVAKRIFTPYPLQVNYYHSPRMEKVLDELRNQKKFDLIYAHLIRMAPYAASFPHTYRILDLTDLISEEIKRSLPFRNDLSKVLYRIELPKITKFETSIVNSFNECWLISDYENEILTAKNLTTKVVTIRNGVNYESYYPTGVPRQRNRLIFVGHMGVFHNIDAAQYLCREILPCVRGKIPGIEIQIVGAEPVSKARKLASLPGVHVLGFVENLPSLLNQAGMFVAPLRFSAGVQNKVLEAMATGTPVITTSHVNNGIGAVDEKSILLADSTEEFVDRIIELYSDPVKSDQIGYEGAEFVRSNFSWEQVLKRLNSIQDIDNPGKK